MDLWALGLFEFDRWSLGHFGIYELDPLELWDLCLPGQTHDLSFLGGGGFHTLPI